MDSIIQLHSLLLAGIGKSFQSLKEQQTAVVAAGMPLLGVRIQANNTTASSEHFLYLSFVSSAARRPTNWSFVDRCMPYLHRMSEAEYLLLLDDDRAVAWHAANRFVARAPPTHRRTTPQQHVQDFASGLLPIIIMLPPPSSFYHDPRLLKGAPSHHFYPLTSVLRGYFFIFRLHHAPTTLLFALPSPPLEALVITSSVTTHCKRIFYRPQETRNFEAALHEATAVNASLLRELETTREMARMRRTSVPPRRPPPVSVRAIIMTTE